MIGFVPRRHTARVVLRGPRQLSPRTHDPRRSAAGRHVRRRPRIRRPFAARAAAARREGGAPSASRRIPLARAVALNAFCAPSRRRGDRCWTTTFDDDARSSCGNATVIASGSPFVNHITVPRRRAASPSWIACSPFAMRASGQRKSSTARSCDRCYRAPRIDLPEVLQLGSRDSSGRMPRRTSRRARWDVNPGSAARLPTRRACAASSRLRRRGAPRRGSSAARIPRCRRIAPRPA